MGLKLGTLTPTRHSLCFRRSPRCSFVSAAALDSDVGPPPSFLRPAALAANASTAVLSWNLSAVNNNPFEYWLTYNDQEYDDLMMGVECVLDDPREHDLLVGDIFTEGMFQELMQMLSAENITGLEEVEKMWRGGDMNLAGRLMISEFVKDKELGAKRLISMPDRITNTVNVVTRKESLYQPPPVCRPSVMNNFEGDLSSTSVWWEQWKQFMFHDALTVKTTVGVAVLRPVQMLEIIPRAKYQAVTELEERHSVPLQVLCLAIFDVIIIYLMNELSPDDTWQNVKHEICNRLYRNKNSRTMDILIHRYQDVDIMCLQEVAGVFADGFRKSSLEATHSLCLPEQLDSKRDQNSLIVIRRDAFVAETVREVTPIIAGHLPEGTTLAHGDLIAVDALCTRDQRQYLIISFHGDTNGLMSLPLMSAIKQALDSDFPGHLLILGMDANTYEKMKPGTQSFSGFLGGLSEMGLATCWGASAEAHNCRTTCSARTSLQPQLNKAVRWKDRVAMAGMDPKDHIVFSKAQFSVVTSEQMGADRQANPLKDNTGNLKYNEGTIFPTMSFPSDHGILSVVLKPCLSD